jgi:hypothetical protein
MLALQKNAGYVGIDTIHATFTFNKEVNISLSADYFIY